MKKYYYILFFIALSFQLACKKDKSGSAVNPQPPQTELPAGAKDGVAFTDNGTAAIVTLYAPDKKSVAIIGEFNSWNRDANKMQLAKDGKTWFTTIKNLNPESAYSYQFEVDGTLRIADPYAELVLDPENDKYINNGTTIKAYPTGKTSGMVSVMQAKQSPYTWKNQNFARPPKNKLVVYELLVRDFVSDHSYQQLLTKLDYLKNLGINAIELMPVNEFEGNLSWGYNPSFYFAPDKYYGTKNDLKQFIDECHGKGIAVILDMVLNHSFGQSPMVQLYFANGAPTAESPWYNTVAKHPYNVGFDFNHESPATRAFAKKVMQFWMQEYQIDGFRFDLSKGFTQKQSSDDAGFAAYDASRVAIWKDYHNFIKSIDNNNFYTILEHFADTKEETELTNEGMMVWTNLNYNMNEATMGWLNNSDFSWGFYKKHGFSKSDGLVAYIESHDEERLNYKNLNYGNANANYVIKNNLQTALKREELAAAFFFAIPGPKMIWQFGELGYDVSINFNGRTGEKPIRWDYFADPARKALYDVYAKLIKLRLGNDVFTSNDVSYDLSKAIKYIKLTATENQVVVVGNFDVVPQQADVDFGSAGVWYDAFGNSINLATSRYQTTLAPGEYHLFSKTVLK
ncbi:alpha-amylase [Pelobium manganitolerans]|uniref:Alpha-amylase n=1 Tax=Pelobium manganitolerans TaxID=1842495 RepID=A0A419SBE6_9SPHI|nr:alpha-amylase family glycosyl hydrolase [Pelobium manganitolerans]RKD20145.1 alpha-amylase [Pelobium manganitolerans]